MFPQLFAAETVASPSKIMTIGVRQQRPPISAKRLESPNTLFPSRPLSIPPSSITNKDKAFRLLPSALLLHSVGEEGVWLFRIDTQVLDGSRDLRRRDLPLLRQGIERGRRYGFGVDFKEAPQGFARVAPAEPVGAQGNEPLRDPGTDQIGDGLQIVGCGNDGYRHSFQRLNHVRFSRGFLRMEPIPAVDPERFVAKLLVTRSAPHVCGYLDPFGKQLLRLPDREHYASAPEKLDPMSPRDRRRPETIQALDDSIFRPFGHGRMHDVLVVEGDVIEDVFLLLVHPAQSLPDDQGHFIRSEERRV